MHAQAPAILRHQPPPAQSLPGKEEEPVKQPQATDAPGKDAQMARAARLQRDGYVRHDDRPLEGKDGKVGIRRFHPKDITPHFTAVRESIPELSSWLVWCHAGFSLEDSAAFVSACVSGWEKGGHHNFVIVDPRDDTFLGSVGLKVVDRSHNFASIGYWVRTGRAREGIASVAVRLIARFGLEQMGFSRLEIVIPAHNRASWRVAEKTGAKREGTLRKRVVLQGKSHDALVYSLVHGDLDDEHEAGMIGLPNS
jgi:ribosomal-protein-serine acetyltransferase